MGIALRKVHCLHVLRKVMKKDNLKGITLSIAWHQNSAESINYEDNTIKESTILKESCEEYSNSNSCSYLLSHQQIGLDAVSLSIVDGAPLVSDPLAGYKWNCDVASEEP